METSGDPGLQQFLKKNCKFAALIMDDVSAMKVLLLEQMKADTDQLALLKETLDIKQVTLSCQSNPSDMESCFSQMRAGLRTYDEYLSHIGRILPDHADNVTRLQDHILNLSDNIQRQMEESGLASVTYPQAENQPLPGFLQAHSEAGSYHILADFQTFLEMIIRTLRNYALSV